VCAPSPVRREDEGVAGILNLHSMAHTVLDRLVNGLVCMFEGPPDTIFFFMRDGILFSLFPLA